jgi:arylsulfatase A-like enzyme
MNKMRIPVIGTLIALVLLSAAFYFIRAMSPAKKVCPDCNVILITVDSVNNTHLGLYGYNRPTSPNLDAWAKDAAVFSQYITSSDLTPITQTSLQTGKYPSHSGVVSFSSHLPETIPTLPELLKKAGYTTVAYGSAPEYYEAGVSGWQQRRANFHRGFDSFFDEYFESQIMPPAPADNPDRWPQKERGVPSGVIDWLSNAPKQKFFLWVPVGTVHWPYNDTKPFHFADKNYQGMFKNDSLHWQLPSQFKRVYKNQLWPVTGSPVPLTPEDHQFVVDRYDDGIYLTDQFLGEVFKTLEAKGLTKNTIVIFTTEHGEEFGEHDYIAHYDIFDPEIRVPLIIKAPGIAARNVAAQVSTVDVLPTLLDMIGLKHPADIDGKSFLPELLSPKEFAD